MKLGKFESCFLLILWWKTDHCQYCKSSAQIDAWAECGCGPSSHKFAHPYVSSQFWRPVCPILRSQARLLLKRYAIVHQRVNWSPHLQPTRTYTLAYTRLPLGPRYLMSIHICLTRFSAKVRGIHFWWKHHVFDRFGNWYRKLNRDPSFQTCARHSLRIFRVFYKVGIYIFDWCLGRIHIH